MPSQTASRVRVIAATIALSLIATVAPFTAPAAEASIAVLCKGYDSCKRAGYSSHGYKSKRDNLYWRMIGGHNCTNYAAYLLVNKGYPNVRPWSGSGDAQAWGDNAPELTDSKPVVGAIAWWNQNVRPAGAAGHVAYVERVISSSDIIISEDNYRGEFYWKRVKKSGGGWPSGFIHFKDSRTPALPAFDATLTDTRFYTDSTKSVAVTPSAVVPGESVWVELSYLNSGSKTWSKVHLGTSSPLDRTSELASEWPSATRPSTQTESTVRHGKVATFGFALTIPSDAAAGTQWVEHFAPVSNGGTWMPLAETAITLTASDLADFDERPQPIITGDSVQGGVLTATADGWSPNPDSVSFQWYRNGDPIAGASAQTLTLTSADVGSLIAVSATALRDGYNPSTQVSSPTNRIGSIYSSTLQVGQQLAVGDQLVSANGFYQLLQRTDGNLMIYDRRTGIPIWATGAAGSAVTTQLTAGGNLTTYSASGKRLWYSHTTGLRAVEARLTDSGHLNLYTKSGKRVWSSLTSGR
jgi:surface antigen